MSFKVVSFLISPVGVFNKLRFSVPANVFDHEVHVYAKLLSFNCFIRVHDIIFVELGDDLVAPAPRTDVQFLLKILLVLFHLNLLFSLGLFGVLEDRELDIRPQVEIFKDVFRVLG